MGTNGGHNGTNPKLTKEQVDQAVHLYLIGKPLAEISAEYNVTPGAIGYHLRQRMIDHRDRVKTPPPARERAPRTRREHTRESYTCAGCGATRQYQPQRGGGIPTHCRYCKTVAGRSQKPDVRFPEVLLTDGSCNQIGDVELFYPHKGGSNKKAKAICAACPVVDICLQYAMDAHEDWGIWGGLSEQERTALRQRTERQEKAA